MLILKKTETQVILIYANRYLEKHMFDLLDEIGLGAIGKLN